MKPIPAEALIEGPNLSAPKPINSDEISSNIISTITDTINRVHSVYAFTPQEYVPQSVADWLKYRTFTENTIGAKNEGDKYRFRDTSQLRERFLMDQGGRTLYVAVGEDNLRLYGAAWIHRLRNDESDFLLADATQEFLSQSGLNDVSVDSISTFATREYGAATGKGLSHKLGRLMVDEYFEKHNTECVAVVGRYSSIDSFQTEISDDDFKDRHNHSFRPVSNGPGWVILAATNQEL